MEVYYKETKEKGIMETFQSKFWENYCKDLSWSVQVQHEALTKVHTDWTGFQPNGAQLARDRDTAV